MSHRSHLRFKSDRHEESARSSGGRYDDFLRAIDRIDPYVKIDRNDRYYIDLRDAAHIGLSAVEYEAMRRLVARTNELLDNGVLDIQNRDLRLAKGKTLDDTFVFKPKAWFGGP